METNTVSLLQKCQENFPYITWVGEKDGEYCQGLIESTIFSLEVTSTNEHSSIKLIIYIEESAIDLLGKYSSQGEPIEALFNKFRSDWQYLNSSLSKATKV
ncbi:MAG TPA: hypothetical protein VE944_30775 [Nostoc sp.]|uniref:hypothetical protein n=1 Tax=Nostoc sp. TaxID=1180 RepID=UPI002D5201E2|nr:hypothetical protein [Nostoc sp.]HYX18676.1 hypothetical protein [Nostoc sp.]